MRWIPTSAVLWLAIVLTGCGGGSFEMHARFINHSPSYASDQMLDQWWIEAQQQPIFLNAVTVYLHPDTPPDVRPPDARAFTIEPQDIDYIVVPNSQNGIPCPRTPLPICFGQTFVGHTPIRIVVADADVHKTTVYEFQNVILWRLGYPLDQR
jgi:hypothetical protein